MRMVWNYRLLQEDGYVDIIECYYDDNKKPTAYASAYPLTGESKEDVIELLEMILEDIKKCDVL